MLVEMGEGLWVEDSTGEIEEIGEDTDRCMLLALALDEAQIQIRAWERQAAVAKAGLLRYQEERRAEYAGVVVRVQQNQRKDVEAPALANWLLEHSTPEAMADVIAASRVPVTVVPLEANHVVRHSVTRPFIVCERARRRAPGAEGVA